MKKGKLAALAAIGCSACALAADEATVLPTITVDASRIESAAEDMPSPLQVFGVEEISRSGAKDLPDLLSRIANIQVRSLNSNPLQAQIAMRGYGENSFGRVKIYVDGEEINSADMDSPNLARIPLGGIERVEIVHGPSPVLYGDGAVAGIVNIVTDSSDCSRKSRVAAKAGSYGTAGLGFATKGGDEHAGVKYSGFYDYVRSDGYRKRSAYDIYSAGATLHKEFSCGSGIAFRANYSNALFEMPGALSYEEFKRNPEAAAYHGDWCRLWNYGFSSSAKIVLSDERRLLLDGVFSLKHRESNWGDYGYANEYDLYSWQFLPRYVDERDVAGLSNRFTSGAEFRFDRYCVSDRSGYNSPHSTFGRSRYALFAQNEIFLAETLSLVAGARAECIGNRWAGYAGLAQSAAHDVMGDYELALVYRPDEDVKMFVKGSRFHRSAFCDELNYTEDGRFLDPETGVSLDAGVAVALDEEIALDANAYWSVADDEIFYNPYAKLAPWGWGGYNCNSPGRTERIGADAGIKYLRENVAEASLRYSFVDARFRDGQYEGCSIPLVAESRVRVEAGVWILDDLEIKAGYRYVAPQTMAGDYANGHRELSGYSLFDAGLYFEPSWAKGWSASLVVDNLLDREYCDFAGWSDYAGAYCYPACGRSVMLGVAYEF